ncbi:U-box domain-containing protein 27-like [Chenopodium quinoa]|uniref:U-box domain-containing protein 27-like n=1 Tax=Chenopodium quinoa TaxID=63459 RepID=UPI000B781053|nr:U-box domain-containing protein 27-like [Chenopodium quinoa]
MGKDELYIGVPSFFKCPISLDVMKSPVSLCTGVTYDRTSIQRWLDSGNNTCPATMQVLDTKDFVPNHTLQRLIQIWSTNHHHSASALKGALLPQFHSVSSSFVSDLIKQLLELETENEKDDEILFEGVVKILCFASESAENRRFLGSNGLFVDFLIRTVSSGGPDLSPDLLEAVLKLLHLVIGAAGNDKMGSSRCDLVSALARVLKTGRPGSRVAAAGILETFAQDVETKKIVFDHQELGVELLGILKQGRFEQEVEKQAVLSCLISFSSPRRNKQKLVRAGGVKTIGDMITSHGNNSNTIVTVELLFTLLEMLAGCTEGRLAIIDDPNCIPMIINMLMKVSSAVNEHGITLLWGLCYLFRDQRVKESVMKSNGGLTKILLLMQSDCSPAVKRMCCDLLRIFRVNSKSCLSSYDTKTTHIMPC